MLAISFISVLLCSGLVFGNADVGSPRFLVHILDYITVDYPLAVKGGKVLSQDEYTEQVEFVGTAMNLAKSLPEIAKNPEIAVDLKKLQELILAKGDPAQVARLAREAETKVIRLGTFETYPHAWPNGERGKQLYEGNCSSCHGDQGHGDGPSSTNLDPKPTDFHDAKLDKISPFQMFNTIRLGVPGTAMAAFDHLSDKEVWDLAFYVASIRYTSLPIAKFVPTLSLADVATLSDEALLLKGHVTKDVIGSHRRFVPVASDSASLQLVREKLRGSVAAFEAGNFGEARQLAISAYLEGIEPVEPALRNRNAELTLSIERGMMELRNQIERRVSVSELRSATQEVDALLVRAEEALSVKESSAWMAFTLAAGIVLREALEAVLILVTLLGVIRSLKLKSAARYVHAGWILAVLVGVAGWFFSGWLMAISGAQREILEGAVSAFAVVILLFFGFWLHKHSEIGRWHSFINELVRTAVDKRNLFVLGTAAFMGVFREAFETVLFLRALLLEVGATKEWSVGLGVLTSFVLVAGLSAIAVRTSANLPVRKLFALSSVMMICLSFVLIGKSIHSFQESGLFSITTLPINWRWDTAGIYPTAETLIPQLLLLAVALGVAWFSRRQSSSAGGAGSQSIL